MHSFKIISWNPLFKQCMSHPSNILGLYEGLLQKLPLLMHISVSGYNNVSSTPPVQGILSVHSIPLACAECKDSLPFSGASSIPLCYVLFSCHPSPPTIPPYSLTSSCHLFLGLPHNLVVPKFIYNTLWGFYFLPFSVHAQTNVTYLTLSLFMAEK
jgi:hypothetical protein